MDDPNGFNTKMQEFQHGHAPFLPLPTAVAAVLGAHEVMRYHNAIAAVLDEQTKGDGTPVTVADLRSDKVIIEWVKRVFDNDWIMAEESGLYQPETPGSRKWKDINHATWTIDGLDGTSSFARGQRYSTVGVAIELDGVPFEASIVNPFDDELIVACSGYGTAVLSFNRYYQFTQRTYGEMIDMDLGWKELLRQKTVRVSEKPLTGGIIYVDALFNNKTTTPKLEFIDRLVDLSGGKLGVRMTGSNIDQQRQVACGRAELTLTDAVGGYWDLAAGALTIKESGGKMVGLDGLPVEKTTQVAIGGPIAIVDQVLPILQDCYAGYAGFR